MSNKDCNPEFKLDPELAAKIAKIQLDPVLSGNRCGPHGWDRSTMGPPPPYEPLPPGIPIDPRFEEAQRSRHRISKLRAYALAGAISTILIGAGFIAVSLQVRALRIELDAARRAPCAALALGLQGADNRLARVRDEAELRAVVGPMSTAIHPVLSGCMDPAEADRLAQQIGEARSPEQAQALIKSARDQLRN